MKIPALASSALALSIALGLGFAATPALADRGYDQRAERYTDYGEVISVQPIYQDVSFREPRQECWTEQQEYQVREGYSEPSYRTRESGGGKALLGGVIGGVVGNQIGRSHGSSTRAGATVAGAIIGSVIANEHNGGVQRHRRPQRHQPPVYESRPVERCRTTTHTRHEQRLRHYEVTYRYRDQTFTTHMNRDPGDRIELAVSVRPARSGY